MNSDRNRNSLLRKRGHFREWKWTGHDPARVSYVAQSLCSAWDFLAFSVLTCRRRVDGEQRPSSLASRLLSYTNLSGSLSLSTLYLPATLREVHYDTFFMSGEKGWRVGTRPGPLKVCVLLCCQCLDYLLSDSTCGWGLEIRWFRINA